MTPAIAETPVVKRNDVTVKMDADVVAEAKMVAASRDVTLAEYLSELVRPMVRKDLQQEAGRRMNPKPPKSKGGSKA